MQLLQEQGEELPAEVREAARLTDYAVEARYPGLAEPVTRREYETAVALAERVLNWVEGKLKGQGEASPAQ
jgi:HEPN domain-containing protein